jgi:anhydro-N-acetylmuramic acid kinase
MEKYHVIGIMSGTSLDGVDLAFCSFNLDKGIWEFEIPFAETFPYPDEWRNKLIKAPEINGLLLSLLSTEYGHFLGKLVKDFILKYGLTPDFIASHGHTVFHQPCKKMTLQIGSGAAIAGETALPVVCDFRSTDVALGGQGAPLVPIGDRLLFGTYHYCLNLGGFANISCETGPKRIAHDVCAVNTILNYFAQKPGRPFDKDGQLARKGTPQPGLLTKLNDLEFYKQPPPKSLGREWLNSTVFPLLETANLTANDLLRTYTEHVAIQIAQILDQDPLHQVLVTGGGACNLFLLERIKALTRNPVIIPGPAIIHYKEALIFALLGVLRMRGETNCLASVTGASRDSSGGAIYWN